MMISLKTTSHITVCMCETVTIFVLICVLCFCVNIRKGGIMRMRVRLLLLFMVASVCHSHEGMEYLKSAIKDLRNMNPVSINRRTDSLHTIEAAPTEDFKSLHPVPTLGLTKGELAALYESAINKGKTIKLDTGDGDLVHAALHEIDSTHDSSDHHINSDDSSGYYYYYYPLKSFMDEISSTSNDQHQESDHSSYHHEVEPHKNHDYQSHYHSHTHKHTVIIPHKPDPNGGHTMDSKKPKALEPLFMAISGFIGMAVMFVLSVLVLPKFGVLKSRGGKQQFTNEIYSITGIVLRAIEGKHCSEKLTCEIGKTANAYNMYNNRFVKFLKRFAPALIAKQIEKIGKYTDKKYKCAAIQCKRKNNNVPSKPKSQKKQIKK